MNAKASAFNVPKPSQVMQPSFTPKQGQYLAFIYNYTLINRQAPAEADMQRFFGVSPPSVHQMVVTLERERLISRTPGQSRSIVLKVEKQLLPLLESVEGDESR